MPPAPIPSGWRWPGIRAWVRIGKAPSSRWRQTEKSPRLIEAKLVSPVTLESRARLSIAQSRKP